MVVGVLNEINELIKRFCPFLTAGIAVVALCWTSITYGAITVLQVMGFNEGMSFLENVQPFALMMGLPAIPVSLIMSQMIRWDDLILTLMRNESLSPTP